MSLYNMLHGVETNARIAMAMLELQPGDVGRFRDAWLEPGGETICVFTRNGGGNREAYEEVTAALRSHPQFAKDFDDDFDHTYATYVFNVPEMYRSLAARLAPETQPLSLQEKTDAAIEAIGATSEEHLKGEPQDRIAALISSVEDAVNAERQELET